VYGTEVTVIAWRFMYLGCHGFSSCYLCSMMSDV